LKALPLPRSSTSVVDATTFRALEMESRSAYVSSLVLLGSLN
jgi:hypothetical protein